MFVDWLDISSLHADPYPSAAAPGCPLESWEGFGYTPMGLSRGPSTDHAWGFEGRRFSMHF